MTMGLRTRLLLAFALLTTLGVGASLLAAERYLSSIARDQVAEDLQRAAEVYSALDQARRARWEAEARVVSEEPRLKAVVRTSEIDQLTVEDVADELKSAAGAQLFALLRPDQTLLADVSEPPLSEGFAAQPSLRQVLDQGGGTLILAHQGALFEVTTRAMTFGADIAGYLLLGHQMDDQVARSTRLQTGSEVELSLDGVVVGAALSDHLEPHRGELGTVADGLSERSLEGERFITLKVPYPGAAAPGAALILARSLDVELAAHRAVRRTLIGIGLGAILLSLLVAAALARGLTRRVAQLSAATAEVGRGNLAVHVPDEGTDEVARLAQAFNTMTGEIVRSREALASKSRLEKELQIAQQIQTSLLPGDPQLAGYRFAATMQPAESVGGDFYDVRLGPEGNLWLCIGDVTSHGLAPGLIMMMAQSALAALIDRSPDASPLKLLVHLNRVLYDNVRERLKTDDHLTLTLLKGTPDGRFVFSGAHLPLLVRRASGEVERIETPGVWVGLIPEVEKLLVERTVSLHAGDQLLLYTDGLTEARSASGAMFDMGEVQRLLALPTSGPEETRDRLVAAARAHMASLQDDLTVVVLERAAQP